MKKIKSFEDACKALKISTALPDVSALPADMQAATTAHYKLMVIARALNGKWKPDWNNTSEWKYYPWFNMGSSGAGFSFDDFGRGYDYSTVGSRLCFKSYELAEYAGKTFVDLYKDYMQLAA